MSASVELLQVIVVVDEAKKEIIQDYLSLHFLAAGLAAFLAAFLGAAFLTTFLAAFLAGAALFTGAAFLATARAINRKEND